MSYIQGAFLLRELPFLLSSVEDTLCLGTCEWTESLPEFIFLSFPKCQFILTVYQLGLQLMMEQLQKKEIEKALQSYQLPPEDKKLYNLLELKLYDLCQNVQIMNKQLTNNQIKDIVSQIYHISNQLQPIYNKAKVPFLYHLLRKMQVNFVVISEILTERLEKNSKNQNIEKSNSIKDNEQSSFSKKKTQLMYQIPQDEDTKAPLLGGIHLYNQNYGRGLMKQKRPDDQQKQSKGQRNIGKKHSENFVKSLIEEINTKAEVEVDSISQQVKNYILNFKECNKVANFISCQNQLMEIIDFFKISQLEALNFLNKSPHNNIQYTEDYLNRLTDLQKDIKGKSNNQKDTMHEKMRLFIIKLRQKVAEIQKLYEDKSKKILEFEKAMRKVCVENSTQTHDGYERKIKQFEFRIQKMEEQKSILLQIRKAQSMFEDEINQLNHTLQLKINENKKILSQNFQLEQQVQSLKKLIRSKNETPVYIQPERKKKKIVSPSESPKKVTTHLLGTNKDFDGDSYKIERYKKKYEKTLSHSSNGNRGSYMVEVPRPPPQLKASHSFLLQRKETEDQYNQEGQKRLKKMNSYEEKPSQEVKESTFKAQNRKNNAQKKTLQQERQVSFKVTLSRKENFTERKVQPQTEQGDFIREKTLSNSPSALSIDASHEDQYTRRSNRKNTLRQRLQVSYTSIKNIEGQDIIRKEAHKLSSKKCIILKERQHKDKNSITALMQITNFSINEQYSLTVQPSVQFKRVYQMRTSQRPSYSSINKLKQINKVGGKPGLKPVQLTKGKNKETGKKDIRKKGANHFNTADMGKVHSIKSISEYEQLKSQKSNQKKIDISKPKQRGFPGVKSHNTTYEEYSRVSGNIEQENNQNENREQPKTGLTSAFVKQCLNDYSKDIADHNGGMVSKKFKQVAASLELLRRIEAGQQRKNGYNKEITKEEKTRIANIIQQLEKDNLSIEQFGQIMKQIVEDSSQIPTQSKLSATGPVSPVPFKNISKHENINKPQNNRDPHKKYEESIYTKNGTINSKNYEEPINKKKGEFNHKNQNTKLLYQQLESFSQEAYETNVHQWNLKGVSIDKLKRIHQKFGKCSMLGKNGQLCQHVHNYMKIINRINSGSFSNKVVLKLPIQLIGQTEIMSKETDENKEKYSKTLDHFNHSYLKSHMTTEERVNQQRQRILPLITNTTNGYYKPKSKVR